MEDNNKPEFEYLDIGNAARFETYLRERGWLAQGERLTGAARAGDGNMNYTLRVRTSTRSFILKQARPWVEKYPDIAAPAERAIVEASFYAQIVNISAVAALMPKLIGVDAESNVLVLEDMGELGDMTDLYRGSSLTEAEVDALTEYITHLHRAGVSEEAKQQLSNRSMRELNHEHIFRLPFDPAFNFDLDEITPGLKDAASGLRDDAGLRLIASQLGSVYLANGGTLLHGDYFPGSWLRVNGGIRVIDPEFCFVGCKEFDVGVMVAHFALSGQPDELIECAIGRYKRVDDFDQNLAYGFAGAEIIRRLIGVAQLPLACGLKQKIELLDRARNWMLAWGGD
ncbi:MAG: phosphotransferase [Acidobacteria bacterium]|nr:phosphotransferase [Acidobacteriota bacterium]